MSDEKELRCCLFCGRDTTSKSMICVRCIGRPAKMSKKRTENDYAILLEAESDELDDFSENSLGPVTSDER
jgi:hypothetical protein